MKKAEKKKSTNVLAALCFAMALALLLSAAGTTLAKYIRRDRGDGAAVAAPFYFSSNLLGTDSPYRQISEPANGEAAEISFTVSNFIDSLRCTSEAISYEYYAVAGDDASGAAIEGSAGRGAVSGNFKTETISISVDKTAFDTDGIVTVVLHTAAPYERTISARFGFEESSGIKWSVAEQSGAVVLELYGGSGGNVTVAWPDGLTPDRTNELLRNAESGAVTFTAAAGESYALTFLKSDPESYFTAESFSVTEA